MKENSQSTFYLNLPVETTSTEDNDPSNEVPLSTKSWRLQLLRLVQNAPQPLAVLCDEPRRFPHFGINKSRNSASSWTSDSTRYTNVSVSRCSSLRHFWKVVGVDDDDADVDDNQAEVVEEPADPKKGSALIAKNKDNTNVSPLPTEEGNPVGTLTFPREADKAGESCVNLSPASSSLSPSSPPQEDGNSSLCLPITDEKSRHTLSLSIQGDSEYWEKFRYSRDYQSSLMIETICNEVFNLKPSPRYKSLMRLSQANTVGKRMEQGKPKSLSFGLGPSNPEHGRVKAFEEKREGGGGGIKSGIMYVSPPLEWENKEKEEEEEEDDEKVEMVGSATTLLRRKMVEEQNQEQLQQQQSAKERRKLQNRYESTTSSVFTTTTEENGDEYYRIVERDKLLKGFGPAFHGYLTKGETTNLLRLDGQYLIRQMWDEEGFILSFRFDGETRNYRIRCEVPNSSGSNGMEPTFYLEDGRKCYNSLDELVREGLITLHLDEYAGSYIDLLVELAALQRSDNLLQSPPAASPGSRKNSRSASFRAIRITSSSSATCNSGGGIGGGGGSCGGGDANSTVTTPSITVTSTMGNSMDIALLIHYFDEEIFDVLAKCQVCYNGLWGPSNKGLKCRDCGLHIHESCIDNVKSECKPDLRTLSPFSTDLTTLVKGSFSSAEGSYGPPYVLQYCINEVEQRGLSSEGIYRVSGSVDEIENLKNLFEKDRVNTNLSACSDIHSITGLAKFFLRQLPDALITQEVFEEFTRDDAGEMTLETVQGLILSLPPAHRVTLKYLLEHLKRVSTHKGVNRMTAFNLSSVLMPSIVCPTNMFSVLELGTKLLHVMITHVGEFNFY